MKRTFYRSKRETNDKIEPLSIQIEKKTPRKRNFALQSIINIVAYVVVFALLFRGDWSNMGYFFGIMIASVIAQVIADIILTKKDETKYQSYLKKVEHQIDSFLKDYSKYLKSVLVSPSKLFSIITGLSSLLYCKMPFHEDFLTVNIGEAHADYPISIAYPKIPYNEKDSLLDNFKKKIDKKMSEKKADILPYGVSLKDRKSISLVNKGLEEEEFMSVVNAVVMDIAAFHSPEEIQMCFCYYPDINIDWCCYLPHVWFGNRRLVFCDSEPEAEFEKLINEALENKTKHTIAVIDVDFLLDLNLYSYFNKENLPDNLYVIFFSVSGVTPTRVKNTIGCEKKRNKIIGEGFGKTIVLNTLSDDDCFYLARKLFNIELVDNRSRTTKNIPERVTFFEMFGIKKAGELPKATSSESTNIQHHFPVEIGCGKESKKTILDFTNDGDGNHCLVTGTNGSGKSEFLLSYILSACAKYSPEYFSFVTIDFKGGLMSSKVRDLPHCRGEFTNGKATLREIARIAKLLESEIDYRENLLNQYNCNGSLSKYHELYKNGVVDIPLPRLLIVVDEAAVFFSEDPSAVSYITKIATVGRQLGMILLLSTQSQNGIIPSQVKTNINVCVDFYSEESIKKGKNKLKGRAIINSNAKSDYSCQVALSSIYDSNFATLDYLSVSGKSRMINGQERKQQFEMIHDEIIRRYNCPDTLGSVLTPNLDEKYSDNLLVLADLQEIYYQDEEDLACFPVGVSDNIYSREYNFFTYEPSKYNLLVYGNPQSGKTTFIKTLLVSMFNIEHGFRPSKMNVYIIAKNPQEYYNLAFPHVDKNILPESQMYYFLLFLCRTINERKKASENSNFTRIIAIIDGCFSKIVGSLDDTLGSLFSYVTSESIKYGISVILTMSSKPGFTSNYTSNFDRKISFYMGDDFEYSGLMHIDAIKKVCGYPGRCLVEKCGSDCKTLETQIALPYRSNEAEVKELKDTYCQLWRGKSSPPPIPLMPETVSLSIDPTIRRIPVGYSEDRSICYWDFEQTNTYLVSYFSDNDVISFMRYTVKAFTCKNFDVILVDNQRGSLKDLKDTKNICYFGFDEKEELKEKLKNIQTNFNQLKDTVLIMFDFAALIGTSSVSLEKELVAQLNDLIKKRDHNLFFVLADFKNRLHSFCTATSDSVLGASLEGANSGMLLGNQPNDHRFGYPSLPIREQGCALNSDWGIHVSPVKGETKKVKFAVEVIENE